MNCQQRRIDISALVDESLEPARIPQVREHLASCEACQEFYEDLLRINQVLESEVTEVDPPVTLWARIEQRLVSPAPPQPVPSFLEAWLRPFRLPAWKYAFAGLVLALILSVYWVQVPRGPGEIDSTILAELDAYRLEVHGNPFLPEPSRENPFFEFDGSAKVNPFHPAGGLE